MALLAVGRWLAQQSAALDAEEQAVAAQLPVLVALGWFTRLSARAGALLLPQEEEGAADEAIPEHAPCDDPLAAHAAVPAKPREFAAAAARAATVRARPPRRQGTLVALEGGLVAVSPLSPGRPRQSLSSAGTTVLVRLAPFSWSGGRHR